MQLFICSAVVYNFVKVILIIVLPSISFFSRLVASSHNDSHHTTAWKPGNRYTYEVASSTV